MLQNLLPQDLSANINVNALNFKDTSEMLASRDSHGWIAQADAKNAATFGLDLSYAGFHLLVLGEHGSGRTSLMWTAMQDAAEKRSTAHLNDMVALFDFSVNEKPQILTLKAGEACKLKVVMEQLIRDLARELPQLVLSKVDKQKCLDAAKELLSLAFQKMSDEIEIIPPIAQHISHIERDVMAYLEAWQPGADIENQLESLLSEAFFGRYRVNVLVSHANATHPPVIYDSDPSLQSLFGGIEAASESSVTPDFLRLRAGNLLRADGGMLMLHLRDLLQDQQNGAQILEKLQRFCRNGTLQIEDFSSSNQSSSFANTVLPVQVKLILIATREDFYQCLDEHPDFFNYFPIKVEFAERIVANTENYAAIAGFVAQKCVQFNCAHFSAEAVACLILAMQRLEEDQTRISTNFAAIERLMLESVAHSQGAILIEANHVKAAINANYARHNYFEAQIRDAIINNELLIAVHGETVGQVNGLTHMELGDASFGSPVRITARCYPGRGGVINIDREVEMSGPNHDKGMFILQSWLSASFHQLAPLSLNASLVFEQEYNGVEGDSASCAELFALLSAMANLPIKQGIAVTGALNQFGEVMPIGGVNEKIEGYFRVCKALGLDGKQGVMIPQRNQTHLMLNAEVMAAVANSEFKIVTISHVLEGIAYLTDTSPDELDATGQYAENTVMGQVQKALLSYKKILENNQIELNFNTK